MDPSAIIFPEAFHAMAFVEVVLLSIPITASVI